MSRSIDDRGAREGVARAIAEIARYNCQCGKWIILPREYSRARPLVCDGCQRRHYWSTTGDVVMATGRVMPALCLDLDGTVRRSKSGAAFIAGPDDIELFPGVEDQIWRYRDAGWLIFGVSNQGGVAHGFRTFKQVDDETGATIRLFARNPWHGIKCCYHDGAGSVEPFCHRSLLRKPGYGMLALLESEAFAAGFIIDWDRSLFVGDRDEDRDCAAAAGITFTIATVWRDCGAPSDGIGTGTPAPEPRWCTVRRRAARRRPPVWELPGDDGRRHRHGGGEAVTAREAGRAWADREWAQRGPAQRRKPFAFFYGAKYVARRAGLRPIREATATVRAEAVNRWRELQAAHGIARPEKP